MIDLTSNDLAAILEDCWRRLIVGAADRRSAYHQTIVATVDSDGAPDARIMILRQADRDQRIAHVHTDARSAKVNQLRRDPRASLLFYDPADRVQLRVGGTVSIHQDDPVAASAWAAAQRMSKVCYAAAVAPGAVIDDPLDALGHLTDDASEQGYGRFTVLRLHIERLEWLSLAASGHRRARFLLAGTAPVGQWLAP